MILMVILTVYEKC